MSRTVLYTGVAADLNPSCKRGCLGSEFQPFSVSFALTSSMASSFWSALLGLYVPIPVEDQLVHGALDDHNAVENGGQITEWYEEELEDDLKWSFAINRVLHATRSEFQTIVLVDTQRFGKALLLDGKLQSAEKDEYIYHENLIHPALLLHENPKTVFIMGGGEGSSAREALKHKGLEKVVMCDIDQVVVEFCRTHLVENHDSFRDEKLQLVFNDAKAQLKGRSEKFDVIIGDLSDPHEGGPCNDLYAKSFYDQVIKPKLNDNGIFVTQAGPASVLSNKVFSSIHNTVEHSFKHVIAFTAHVPSYADSCGWVVASDQPLKLDAELLNQRIKERIDGELRFLDGDTIVAATKMNKTLNTLLAHETHIITEENVRFAHGRGVANNM